MSTDLSQFYQLFFEEAAEHLTEMERLLLGVNVSAPSPDDLNAIFRAAHSIKGGAATFGFNNMTEVAHVLETLLDKLRKQKMALTGEMFSAFLEARDVLTMQLAAHRGQGAEDAATASAACEKLQRLASAAAPAPVVPELADSGFELFMQKTASKEEQEELDGCGFFVDLPIPSTEPATVVDVDVPRQVVRRATDTPDGDYMRTGMRATDRIAVSPQTEASTIRVSTEKVDQLLNLMGEIVITQAMLTQAVQAENYTVSAASSSGSQQTKTQGEWSERILHSLHQLESNTRNLQEVVMSIRMMPISFVFNRFPRLVHDLAGKLHKQVELKLVGETTALDKGLIEKISDPLTHLVRNSLDHGIELPQQRIAAGKDACGTITLKAFHQGGHVVIEVTDDGAGLNRARILDKAQEHAMPLHDGMSDQEVWELVMEPGFSTAEVLTDLSGRGVGMDVVKRNITGLGGHIKLDSVAGAGMRVTIRLPLTLAILDGLSVAVGHETYIIPLNAIIESLPGTAADLKTVSGEKLLLCMRGEYLPVIELHKLFGIETQITEAAQGILVLLEAGGKKAALLVDGLVGQHQVVLKSLESNYRKVPCVSGATIMGDGRVALILDAAALVRGS